MSLCMLKGPITLLKTESLPVIPSHQPITTWQDWLDTHKDSGRLPWPARQGGLIDLWVTRWFDCTAVDRLPLSALVQAAPKRTDEPRLIGILWSETRPLTAYPIPLLWVCGREVVRL